MTKRGVAISIYSLGLGCGRDYQGTRHQMSRRTVRSWRKASRAKRAGTPSRPNAPNTGWTIVPTAGLEVFERVRRFTGKSTPSILLSEDLVIPGATELASLTVLTKPVTEMKGAA